MGFRSVRLLRTVLRAGLRLAAKVYAFMYGCEGCGGSYNAQRVTRVSLSDWLALQARIRGFENPRLLRDRPSDEAASACGNWGAVPSNRVWGFGLCGYCETVLRAGLQWAANLYAGLYGCAGCGGSLLGHFGVGFMDECERWAKSLYFMTPANEQKWLHLRKFH